MHFTIYFLALFFLPAFAQPLQVILPKVGTFVNLNAQVGDKAIAVIVGYQGLKVIGAIARLPDDAGASDQMPATMVSMSEIHHDSHLKGYILRLQGKIIDMIKAREIEDIKPMSNSEVLTLRKRMKRE